MGNLKDIDKALDDKIAIEVAKMLATSHEYKTPNVDGALAIVKNYKWEKSTEKISNLEGINKPVNKEKVFNIAEGIKKNKGRVNPFIVVNKLNGIYPQTLGKKILLDGHHRKEACELLGIKEVPVYKGTFTGGAQIPKEELREKTAAEKNVYYHAAAGTGAYLLNRELRELVEEKTAAEKDMQSAYEVGGLAGVIGGGSLIKKQLDRGNLTGRETMWHNTANENVSSILEKGLDSKKL